MIQQGRNDFCLIRMYLIVRLTSIRLTNIPIKIKSILRFLFSHSIQVNTWEFFQEVIGNTHAYTLKLN